MTTGERVRQRLHQAAGEQAGQPNLDAIAQGVRRGRRRRVIGWALAVVPLVVAAAVVTALAPTVVLRPAEDGVPPPGEEVEPGAYHPDRIRLRPEQVHAGEEVEVFFPQESTRGYTFWLERSREVGFHPPEWWLEPDFAQVDQAHDVPRYAPAGEEFVTADGDVWGPGPDLVRVPPEAQPGEYRLCAEWDGETMCARLLVLE